MADKIWAVLSVENNYDQPNNNLVVFWLSKPSFKMLKDVLMASDEEVGKVLKGQRVRIYGTDYRLENLQSGKWI